MAPYKALYGRKCRSPLCWDEVEDSKLFAPELLQKMKDQVKLIWERMATTQSRRKSYADIRRSELTFKEGDCAYLKVSPMKGVKRFRKKGKLSQRYIGPYQIMEKVGLVAYRIVLPEEYQKVHDVFRVSLLRKSFGNQEPRTVIPKGIKLQLNLTYEEKPI